MSAFTIVAPQFHDFLTRIKDDPSLASRWKGAPENARFVPRNFLIEERLDVLRVESYAAEIPAPGPVDFSEWNDVHNQYLSQHVFRTPPATHNYRLVARDNTDVCPETFRANLALLTFQGTDLDTNLIRLVPVADLAWMSRREREEDRIFSLGEQVAFDPSTDTPARQELSQILDDAYSITNDRCDHRPAFAAFYEDFKDDELRDPRDASWANRVRDRLGVYRLSQFDGRGLPHRVFLFRYAVKEVPRHPGDNGLRPLAVPVVIDHRLSEAFCPAPRELDRGRGLNLQADALEEPAREVLHLFMPMSAKRLFRAGLVTTPVTENLAGARRDHLIWMQLAAGRNNYASDTDADLFS